MFEVTQPDKKFYDCSRRIYIISLHTTTKLNLIYYLKPCLSKSNFNIILPSLFTCLVHSTLQSKCVRFRNTET